MGTAFWALTGTTWGHERLRTFAEREVSSLLAPGARLAIGALDGSATGAWTADSVAVLMPDGQAVVEIARLTVSARFASLLRGDVRIGVINVERPRVSLVQDRRGRWNAADVLAPRLAGGGSAGARRLVTIDSIAIRGGVLSVAQPGPSPDGAPVRRRISAMEAAFGSTTVSSRTAPGGSTQLRSLTFAVDAPAVARVAASARVDWWNDSLRFSVPALRLPGSRASATGKVAWSAKAPVRLTIDVRADSIAFADLHALDARVPASGLASATIAFRSGDDDNLRIDVRDVSLQAGRSRASGSATVVTGRLAQLRDVNLVAPVLDLDLVRAVVGDSALPPAWRGDLALVVAARGGTLDSLVVDSLAASFHDARTGATSRVRVSGSVALADTALPRVIDAMVRLDSVAIRTLGALAPAADSINGMIEGTAHIAGDATALVVRDFRLRHVDGPRPVSVVSGNASLRPGRQGRWLSVEATLDTVALATLARGRVGVPLAGTPHGRVSVTATGDTVALDATLAEGDATVGVAGTALLAGPAARVTLAGTIRDFDPRRFVLRRDLPPMRLTGTIAASVGDEDVEGDSERHVEVLLDSTSRIGESAIREGDVRAGVDHRGFHLDTAAVVADGWGVHARGRLARDSTAADTLTFAVRADSLAVFRTVVLDTAGAPLLPDLGGQVLVSNGSLVGSMTQATLRADAFVSRFVGGGTTVDSGAVTVAVGGLPDRGAGEVRGTAFGVAAGPVHFDTVAASARIVDGTSAVVAWRAAVAADSAALNGGATFTWPDRSVRAVVDSLRASVAGHAWRLAAPATVVARGGVVDVDTARLRSDHGATVVAAATWPDRGPVRADVAVEGLGFEELAFLGALPADLAGVITARAHVGGTRSAPTIDATATLDSIRSDDRERPSLSVTARYADRKASVTLAATSGGRRVLSLAGDIPLDLSFRDVADRVLNAPMSLRLEADSASLVPFEGLAPRIRNLVGTVNGAVDVGGTLRRPRGTGTLTLRGGGFEVPRAGFGARRADAELVLSGDSVLVRQLRVSDTDSPRDTAAAWGVVRLTGNRWSEWEVQLQSVANRFRVIDDPRLATAEADWDLRVAGRLRSPRVSGNVTLPYAMFTIGPQRRQRVPLTDSTGAPPAGTPYAEGVVVALGSDVRLRSREASVQLAGSVELFGPLNRPWVSGTVQATRGTYRVDLGVLKRTFRVDSGVVILEGTTDVPPALDISASYVVRQPESDDVTIRAHLYGTTDRPRLDLSSDLGTAVGQSEIISYLVFGKPSFAVPEDRKATVQTAYQALVPSFLGGWIEGALGTVLPFFNTLQVTTVGRDDPRLSASNPIEGLLSSFAVTGGRQVGSDTFLSITTGVCTGSTVATTNNSPFWFGTAAEYRPKRSLGAAISIDPGPAPCSRVTSLGDAYQIGFDLLYDWRFGRRR
ncbi:MAG: translocation/assembly module TamB domain-containing protein [Gemmatimonadota bacterium]|nr:translocation/assembly module TamB domain-containing protein [Gemmatimonadota bacterium]